MPDNSLSPMNFPKEHPKKEEEKLYIWQEKLGLTSPDLESFLSLFVNQKTGWREDVHDLRVEVGIRRFGLFFKLRRSKETTPPRPREELSGT